MTDSIWQQLAAPFSADLERTFSGRGGKQMTYIEPRDVMDRLDSVLTPSGWQFATNPVDDHVAHGRLSVWDGSQWLVREDFGYPNNSGDGDHEFLKEAVSDALRRCAMGFGVARYLYRRDPVTAARPTAAPRTAPAPLPAAPPPEEPYPWNDPQSVFPDAPLVDECPDHHKPWKYNSKGGYCPTKVGTGWCQRRPVAA